MENGKITNDENTVTKNFTNRLFVTTENIEVLSELCNTAGVCQENGRPNAGEIWSQRQQAGNTRSVGTGTKFVEAGRSDS